MISQTITQKSIWGESLSHDLEAIWGIFPYISPFSKGGHQHLDPFMSGPRWGHGAGHGGHGETPYYKYGQCALQITREQFSPWIVVGISPS